MTVVNNIAAMQTAIGPLSRVGREVVTHSRGKTEIAFGSYIRCRWEFGGRLEDPDEPVANLTIRVQYSRASEPILCYLNFIFRNFTDIKITWESEGNGNFPEMFTMFNIFKRLKISKAKVISNNIYTECNRCSATDWTDE